MRRRVDRRMLSPTAKTAARRAMGSARRAAEAKRSGTTEGAMAPAVATMAEAHRSATTATSRMGWTCSCASMDSGGKPRCSGMSRLRGHRPDGHGEAGLGQGQEDEDEHVAQEERLRPVAAEARHHGEDDDEEQGGRHDDGHERLREDAEALQEALLVLAVLVEELLGLVVEVGAQVAARRQAGDGALQ